MRDSLRMRRYGRIDRTTVYQKRMETMRGGLSLDGGEEDCESHPSWTEMRFLRRFFRASFSRDRFGVQEW
jgi:hypothetical protein